MKKVNEPAFVVVFPSIFARKKIVLLLSNIKKILKIQNLQFENIFVDDDVIVIKANDPVFVSHEINRLFGIEYVSIARRTENKFNDVVSTITKIGSNILLVGELFYIKVDGFALGFLPKDIEIAATGTLVEKVADIDCKPGTESKYDKMIHCHLTKNNAYVSIFLEKGHGGIPYDSQGEEILCCIFDEFSAISCLETIKQGFQTRVAVCYSSESNLMELVKIINRILPRLLSSEVILDFYHIPIKHDNTKSTQQKIFVVSRVLVDLAKKYKIHKVSLALSPLVFPMWLIEEHSHIVTKEKLLPWIPLAGIDNSIFETAREIGLAKYLHKIEKYGQYRFTQGKEDLSKLVKKTISTRKTLKLKIGPNNIHDILNSINH